MRQYRRNSPQAAARILALAVLADGELDAAEMSLIDALQDTSRFGLSEQAFEQVLRDFCSDVLTEARVDAAERCMVSPAIMKALFAEIDDEVLRNEIVRLALRIIRADLRFHRGESIFLQAMLRAWQAPASPAPETIKRQHAAMTGIRLQTQPGTY
ncbi:hypothetical protein [Viridibacterium curvum]|uniref:TerB family tellurite resistance protein n=1 Tax=Viridibacterium curvum TaxID=1101404 RepID=A0ABP9QPW0_9RHOO